MRLLPRQAADVGTIFTSLSLAIANYKPVPVLPTSAGNALAAPQGPASFADVPTGSALGSTKGNSFQVQSSPSALHLPGQDLSVQEWGEPSVLYVPTTGDSGSDGVSAVRTPTGPNRLAATATATIGPGNCPVIAQNYTPSGGWAAVPPPTFPSFDPVKANIMRYRQQVGVNLGSWFVQENWMDAPLFKCSTGGQAAEFDVLAGYGSSADGVANVTQKMLKHWDTWITEADFQKMAAVGINTVRLPIGYWSVGPYFTNNSPFQPYANVYQWSWRFVARAINWAAKYDIGVVLDLHGAYGSQNGQAHSGTSDGKVDFFSAQNMNLTTQLLVWLAHEVSGVTNIVGIELLNEPQNRPSLWTWYNATMDAMRQASDNAATVPLYFHDAFSLKQGAQFVSQRSDFVVQDHHSYYVYTAADTAMSAGGHVSQIQGSIANSIGTQSAIARRNLVVGEWSCALAPSSLSQSSDPNAQQTEFCGAQNTVYSNATAGWHFWSWKLRDCDNNGGWCFQQAIKEYITAPFNAWGLPDTVSGVLANLTSDQQARFSDQIVSAVNALVLPVLPTALLNNEDGAEQSIAGDVASTAASVGSAVGAAAGAVTQPLSALDTPRIGKVMTPPSPQASLARRTSGGSVAARARAFVQQQRVIEARAANGSASSLPLSSRTRTLLAQNSGYSDGFLSAKIFASSTSLSRLGFGVQYMQDSWAARLAQGKLVTSNQSAYQKRFLDGVTDAEAAIVQTIQNALSSVS